MRMFLMVEQSNTSWIDAHFVSHVWLFSWPQQGLGVFFNNKHLFMIGFILARQSQASYSHSSRSPCLALTTQNCSSLISYLPTHSTPSLSFPLTYDKYILCQWHISSVSDIHFSHYKCITYLHTAMEKINLVPRPIKGSGYETWRRYCTITFVVTITHTNYRNYHISDCCDVIFTEVCRYLTSLVSEEVACFETLLMYFY